MLKMTVSFIYIQPFSLDGRPVKMSLIATANNVTLKGIFGGYH